MNSVGKLIRTGSVFLRQARRVAVGRRRLSGASTSWPVAEGCGQAVTKQPLWREAASGVHDSSLLVPSSLDTESFDIVQDDMDRVYKESIDILRRNFAGGEVFDIVNSYYEGHGNIGGVNLFLAVLVAKALNVHNLKHDQLNGVQIKTLAIIDLIFAISILLDDVYDDGTSRRNAPTAHERWSPYKVVMACKATTGACVGELAKLKSDVAIAVLRTNEICSRGQTMSFRGDYLQGDILGNVLEWHDYKSGSVYGNGFLALARATNSSVMLEDNMQRFGHHLGLLIALVDDIRDVRIDMETETIGVPVAVVLEERPVLEEMVRRRFKGVGDVERGVELVRECGGVEKTQKLAARSFVRAMKHLDLVADSRYKDRVRSLVDYTYSTGKVGFKENEYLDLMGKRGY